MNENIKLCAKWLDSLVNLSPNIKASLNKNKLTSNELANELRNGVVLCNLLNNILPNSIDLSQLIKHADSSRILSAFNINLFLESCKLHIVDLNEKYYFNADLLYDHIDLKPEVLRFLSQLSKCKSLKIKTINFNLTNDYSEIKSIEDDDEDQYYEKNLDIYKMYAPLNFFLNNNEYNEINEAFKSSNDSKTVYLFKNFNIQIKTSDYVIRELLFTEESYLNVLTYLQTKILQPLSKVMLYEDFKTISMNIETILTFHKFIHAKLLRACDGGQGRSIRICNVFSSHKKQFIHIYAEYFQNLNDAIELIKQLKSDKKTTEAFKAMLESLESKYVTNGKRFVLNQLIVCPFQRITKYHLLLKELFFNTEKNKQEAKQTIESTWKAMEDICTYLNQSKRDQEFIEKINSLKKSLNGGLSKIDLMQYGRFIKDESIVRLSKEAGKKIIFLFEKSLFITNTKYVYFDSFPIDENLMSFNSLVKTDKCFSLNHNVLDKQYVFHFKTEKLKQFWIELIQIVKATQTFQNKTHKLQFTNFNNNIVECNVCKKYLNGIFFQGFKCDYCTLVFHKECLNNCNPCQIIFDANSQSTTTDIKQELKYEIKTLFEKSPLLNTTFKAFKAIKKHENELNKDSASKIQLLKFDKDDFIYVSEMNTNGLYKGFKLKFNCGDSNISNVFKEEGYVSKAYITEIDKLFDLKFYSWYLECDKYLAMQIFEPISTDKSSVFMVRYDQTKYVISIKLKDKKTKHIQIETNTTDSFEADQSNKYFIKSKNKNVVAIDLYYTVDKKRYFKSIVNLVNFFTDNSFSDYFIELNKLEKPYRETLPIPLYSTIANNDLEKNKSNNSICLRKSRFYFVLKELENNSSLVYNSEGLQGCAPNSYLDRYYS